VNAIISQSVETSFLLRWAVECRAFLNRSVLDKVVINTLAIGVKRWTLVVKHMEDAQPMPSVVSRGDS
jgi:hypothetical protein